MTARGHVRLAKSYAQHETVKHSLGEYVNGMSHIQTVECFFSLLKRGIMGSFHSVSEAHLQRYAEEFAFRWNHREIDDEARTNEIIKATAGQAPDLSAD